MRILIALPGSQYGAGVYFLKSLADGLEKYGCMVEILDLNIPVIAERIEKEKICKTKVYDVVFLFNAAGIESVKRFIEDEDTIIWNFMVDHPYYHTYRMDNSSGNCIVSFPDYNHVAFCEEYFKNIEYLTFMPHGGGECKSTNPYEERKYEVVFTGSYGNPKTYTEKLNRYSKEIQQFLEDIIVKLHEGQDTYENLLLTGLKGNALDECSKIELLEEFSFIDGYVRQINRMMMLEVIASQKIHIHIWGNGWENYESNYPEYLHIHPACTFEESLEIMADAKIVLNNIPLFRNGSHERVFSAMLCGAVCVSERTIYLENEFKENEELVFFDYAHLEQLPLKVKFLLEHPALAKHMAVCGYQKAKYTHTWEARAEQILDVLCQVKQYQKIKLEKDAVRFVENVNCYDEEFNNILKLIYRVDEEMLYEKLKHRYLGLVKGNFQTAMLREKGFATYPYWGKLNYKHREFEVQKQRAHLLKTVTDDFIWLYERLNDVSSRRILTSVLAHWIYETSDSLNGLTTSYYEQYFDFNLITCTEREVFVDIGAYNGATLLSFMRNYKKYHKIYCYETDEKNAEHLEKIAENYKNIEIRKYALGNRIEDNCILEGEESGTRLSGISIDKNNNGKLCRMPTLDEDVKEKITFIKMDVEGAERYVLEGAKRHIAEEHPKLAIAVYHGNEDIIRLPRMIDEMYSDYKFYLRYYGGNLYPNEIVLYAIPYQN